MMKEFPNKSWKRRSIDNIIKKIDREGTTVRIPGSGRPKSAKTDKDIELVSELIFSQDDKLHSHKSQREIQRITGISRSSIQCIVKKNLALNQYKRIAGQQLNNDCKIKRLQRSQQLLQRFPTECSVSNCLCFTDEKTFSAETPSNSQNNHVYAQATRKHGVS